MARNDGATVSTQFNEDSNSNTTSASNEVDVAQKYHVLMELGRGGTAVVSAGIARGIGGFSKLIVLKTIKEDFLSDRETVKMFVNEARLSARMNHPNVVQVYEVYRQNKLPVIVMEYLDGQSLAKFQSRAFGEADYTAEVGITILCKVLAGLHYAHTLADYDGTPLAIVHRDVSPHNVMLTYDGQVKLVDFGIAKLNTSSQDTKTGVVKGKIGYMAPEQLEGDALDHRGDVFAVGVMLWETIARRRLWGARTDAEIVRCLIFDEIPSLQAAKPDVDPELERICSKALATRLEARYSSAAEFQTELENYLSQRGAIVQQHVISELVCKACADLRANSQELLKAELAKFAAAAPDWDDALQAFESLKTPLPEPDAVVPKRRSKTWLVMAIGLLTTASGVTAYWLMSNPRSQPPVVVPEPIASVNTPPSPRRISLGISVRPGHAALYLDGRRLSTAPVSESLFADDIDHELRAEAEGFEPLRQSLRLDSDQELSLTLTPLPKPVVETANAQPEPRATGRQRRRRPSASTAAPVTPVAPVATPAPPSCNPPYFIGSDGLKHYRRECL
jgi:serine/threonine-protein kinase